MTINIKYIFTPLLILLFLSGCNQEPASISLEPSELPLIDFQGSKIPKFPTAQGQLNYARSGFIDAQEKVKAFKIIPHLFPDAKIQCGHAALMLAYLNLGDDYRFARQHDFINAVNAFHEVIEKYTAYPEILVKATWYLGWIHCDLLNQKETGLSYYRDIVQKWPDIEMGITSPVPWVSLVYSTHTGSRPAVPKSRNQWASIALLEIIRHEADTRETKNAFDTLWQQYRKSVVTGLALHLMLGRKDVKHHVRPLVDEYLSMNIANQFLSEEIETQADEI